MEKSFFDSKPVRKPRKFNGKKRGQFSKKSTDSRMDPRKYSSMPPELSVNPIVQYKRRYVASAAISGSLTIYNLLDSKIMAITTIAGIPIARAIRLKRVRIWAPVATLGTPVTVSLFPNGVDPGNNSFVDLPKRITDTSIDTNKPAYLEYKPNEEHPSGSWHWSVLIDANLVNIVAPINSIMDLDFEMVVNVLTLQGYTPTLVAATPGLIYARNVITNFVPQAVNVI